MEALNKIGEFFFDDGHVSEEERLLAYQRYKEKLRNNKKEGTTQTKNIDTKVKKVVPASSRRGHSSASRTTRSSAVVSTTDSVSSSHSRDSSTDDLESMIPETVCADLSVRSVSSRSVISESATDTGSSKDGHYSTSDSLGSNKKEGSGTGTRSASRTASARDDGSTHSGSSDGTTSARSPRQLLPDRRVLVAKSKGHTPSRSSLYSRFIPNTFRLRSGSVSATTKQDMETVEETDVTVDQGMMNQLMEYISSGDEGEDDESEDSRSMSDPSTIESSSSQDSHSHSHASSLQGTNQSGTSSSRSTVTTGTSEVSISKEENVSSHRKQRKPVDTELPVAVTAANSEAGFEAGIHQDVSLKSFSKAIHGWIEGKNDQDGASGDRIELTLSSYDDDIEELLENGIGETTLCSPTPSSALSEKLAFKPSRDTTDTKKRRRFKSLFSRSAPIEGSALFQPSTTTSYSQGTSFFTNSLLRDQASSASANTSVLKTIRKTDLFLMTVQSPVESNFSIAGAETFSTNPATAMQQISNLGSSKNEQSRSVMSHQVQSTQSGVILSNLSNASSTSMLIQDGTMESTNLGDLHEFIEVTYDEMGIANRRSALSPAASLAAPPTDTQPPTQSASKPSTLSSETSHVLREEPEHTQPCPQSEIIDPWAANDVAQLSPEESHSPSPRKRKSFFGSRFLQRKKDKEDADSQAISARGQNREMKQARHQKAKAKESIPSITEKTTTENKQEDDPAAADLLAPRGNHKKAMPERELREEALGQAPKQSNTLASNGFMQAIENLQINAGGDDEMPRPPEEEAQVEEQSAQDGESDNRPIIQGSHRRGRMNLFSAKVHRGGTNTPAERNHHGSLTARPNDAVEETEEANFASPRRKGWVQSFSSARKKKLGQGKLHRSNDESHGPNLQNHREDNLGLVGRLPSTLPLPRGKKMGPDGAANEDFHAQTTTYGAGASHANRWHAGHLSSFVHQEKEQRLRGVADGETHSNEYYKDANQAGTSKPVEREGLPMKDQEHIEVQKSGQDQAAEPTKLKSKKGLGKLKLGVKGILRWKQRHDPTTRQVTNSLDNHNENGAGIDDGDEPPLQDNDPLEEKVPDASRWSGRAQADKAFLMQHQMMMQSINPTWQQPVRMVDATPQTVSCKDRHSGRGGKEARSPSRLEREDEQTKLQRVLGKREKQKKSQQADSTLNSLIDPQIPHQKVEEHLYKILRSLSSSSSASHSSAANATDDDVTQDYTYAEDTMDGNCTGTFSIRNQRVLETLRLLHAVKRKKRKEIHKKREIEDLSKMRARDCNVLIDPIMDEIEEAACGGGIRFS